MKFDPSGYETVISDARLERLVNRILSTFDHRKLADAEYVTFIQPPRETTQTTDEGVVVPVRVPPMAIFAVLTPKPRATRPGQRLMSTATVALSDFREVDLLYGQGNHPVDPAWQLLKTVVSDHIRKLDDLNALIN